MCVESLAGGGTVFACGNGGSSAQALHLVEELSGRYKNNRAPLRAVALGADAPALTCIANDFGYDEVFSRPLLALGRASDVLVAFSTSGNSPSIVRALESARGKRMGTVLLTGQSGGRCAALAECVVRVPSANNARVQEVHTFFLHGILEAVEEAVASGKISAA
jgi:D-sedoheptulose 7-phosphate isomerase